MKLTSGIILLRGCLTILAKAIYHAKEIDMGGNTMEKSSMWLLMIMHAFMQNTKDSIVIKKYRPVGNNDFEGGIIVYASLNKANHYSLDMNSICGCSDFDLMQKEDAKKALESDLWVLRNQKSLEDQRDVVTRKDGSITILSVTKTPWHFSGSNSMYVFCIARDITAREKAHSEAEDMRSFMLKEVLDPLLLLRDDFKNVGIGHELEMIVLNIQKKLISNK
jgi:PAS domain S-box-containing protein